MKGIILCTMVMLGSVTTGLAQKTDNNDPVPARPNRFHHRHHRELPMDLQFSNQQKEQMNSIRHDFYHNMAVLRKNESISVKEMRDQKADLIKTYRESIQNILTPGQKDQLNERRKKNEEKRKIMAGKKLEKMRTRLNLNDEQTAKIQNLNSLYRNQLGKYHEGSITGWRDRREEPHSLRIQHKEALQAILSPDQQKMLDDWKKDKMGRF
jgi:Spy/CpxP family protein refolding chaperone